MPKTGQIISNSITGDTYEFMETAADTHGDHVTMKATIKAKGHFVPDHFHTLQDESFEVLSGTLTIWQDGKASTLHAGDKIKLLKNIPHNHFNNEAEPVTYLHTIEPALDFDYLVENLVGLSSDGKSKNGRYGLVQELVTLKYVDSKSYLADIPVGVQKVLMNIIAPVGHLLGYRGIYKKYSGIEK